MPTVPSERMPRGTVPPTINRDPSGSAAGVWANAELARPPKKRIAVHNRIGTSSFRGGMKPLPVTCSSYRTGNLLQILIDIILNDVTASLLRDHLEALPRRRPVLLPRSIIHGRFDRRRP